MTEYEKQLMLEWNRLPQYMRKIGDTYLYIRQNTPDISAFTLAILMCEEYHGKKDQNIVHDMVLLRRKWLNDRKWRKWLNDWSIVWYNG
jgi:hypothetical protein